MYCLKWKNKETDEIGGSLFNHDKNILQKMADMENEQNTKFHRYVVEDEPEEVVKS